MKTLSPEIAGWGRYPVQRCELERPERHAELTARSASVIARGQGRSYGDAALNEGGRIVLTERINRFAAFDTTQGIISAEAGVTLAELLAVSVPRGWFPSVTPGTQYVSLGGCIAADVHGKNHHHDGAFSRSVREFELVSADGKRLRCSPRENADAFWATVGGMGLTGIVGDVEMQLRSIDSAYINARHTAAKDLEQAFRFLQDAEHDARYTVAWIDLTSRGAALGRSVVMAGDHAAADALPRRLRTAPLLLKPRGVRDVPFDMPGWLLNPLTIRAFNALYYRVAGRKRAPFVTDYQTFFYPLDALGNWNRLYGRRGFLQYQCVVPTVTALAALQQLLEALAASGHPAFLGVLKRLGEEGAGQLSFPMAGYTLAMDLPMTGPALLKLLEELDAIVLRHGGRVYLAKDARLAAPSFRAMYPRLEAWWPIKQALDPDGVFSSSLSRRLSIGGVA